MAASNTGRYRAARRWYTLALERSEPDQDLTARIEGSLAYVEAELGRPAEAMALCQRALARRGVSERTRGIVTSQRGLLRMRRGDARAALRDLTRAIEALADEPEFVGRLHLNRGDVYLQRGEAEAAEESFRISLRYLADVDLPVLRAKAQHNRGCAKLLQGDLVEALADMDEARPVLAPLSEVSRAVGEQDRAEVLIAAGLVREGERALREAAAAYGRRGLHRFQAEAELSRARALLHRDPGEARRVARRSARRFRASGSETWALRAETVAVMAATSRGDRSRALLEEIDQLVCHLHHKGLPVDAASAQLCAVTVLIRRRELDEARERLRRVRVSRSAPLTLRLMSSGVHAQLSAALGRSRAAQREVRRGLAEFHVWQSSFGSLDLQSGVVGHARSLAAAGLSLAVADGRPEVVFEWSERARTLVSRVVPVRPPADEAVARELTELRWLQSRNPEPHSAEYRRMNDLRQAIRQHSWHGGGSGEVSEPCSLAELRAGLGDGVALVAHVVAAGELHALVVTDDAATVTHLGSRAALGPLLGGMHADLDVAGADLPPRFAATVRSALAARLSGLSDLLVAPVRAAIGDRQVVLTPSGALAGMPWGLLEGMAGRPLRVARSATSWLAAQQRPPRSGSAGFVAGPRVARAEAEVTAASSCWPRAQVLVGPAATAAAVSELASRVDVLHVAAHGRHSAENPLFSGVELVDGPWFGYDIDQLATVPDVVLLSACEVGRSQVRFGSELVGMTTAWLHAGVGCVIASAAAVNDAVAHDVFIDLHRGLGEGLDPAVALARAMPDDADSPPAPFVCFC